MKIFVLTYDRKASRLLDIKTFSPEQRLEAQNLRLELELAANHAGVDYEIVLLEGETEDAIRQSHGRYFKSLKDLLEELRDAMENAVSRADAKS